MSHFVRVASELLQGDDVDSSTAQLAETWSAAQLAEILRSDNEHAILLAAIVLGRTGTVNDAPVLVACLGHTNPHIVSTCEDALWAIWVRAGGDDSVAQLHAAMALGRDDWHQALPLLHTLIDSQPEYAEARHQFAIAQHQLGNFDLARDAYQKTLELNPLHYPAHCALGHLAVEANKYRDALSEYQAALAIHPNLAELQEIVPQLDQAIAQRIVA